MAAVWGMLKKEASQHLQRSHNVFSQNNNYVPQKVTPFLARKKFFLMRMELGLAFPLVDIR
jgi:hypothetical protein